MRYVIIRDDDTNAFTPVECLERLYRPFLDRGLPVNLAVIPAVTLDAKMGDGRPEGFLLKRAERATVGVAASAGEIDLRAAAPTVVSEPVVHTGAERTRPIGENQALVDYMLDNPGYKIVQHG